MYVFPIPRHEVGQIVVWQTVAWISKLLFAANFREQGSGGVLRFVED